MQVFLHIGENKYSMSMYYVTLSEDKNYLCLITYHFNETIAVTKELFSKKDVLHVESMENIASDKDVYKIVTHENFINIGCCSILYDKLNLIKDWFK